MGAGAGQAIGAATGAIGGIYNTIQGAKQARDAERALRDYKRQELNNVAEGLQVSTLGSDLQREEQARLASGQIGALREGGTRTLIGGLGRVEAGNQRVMQQTAADLDMQQKQIDQMQAEDEARIRSMTENREIGDLSALSSQVSAGNQMKANGMAQITQAGSMAANLGKMGGGHGMEMPKVENVNQLQPQGAVSFQSKIQTTPYPTSQFGQFGQGMFAQPNPYVTQQY